MKNIYSDARDENITLIIPYDVAPYIPRVTREFGPDKIEMAVKNLEPIPLKITVRVITTPTQAIESETYLAGYEWLENTIRMARLVGMKSVIDHMTEKRRDWSNPADTNHIATWIARLAMSFALSIGDPLVSAIHRLALSMLLWMQTTKPVSTNVQSLLTLQKTHEALLFALTPDHRLPRSIGLLRIPDNTLACGLHHLVRFKIQAPEHTFTCYGDNKYGQFGQTQTKDSCVWGETHHNAGSSDIAFCIAGQNCTLTYETNDAVGGYISATGSNKTNLFGLSVDEGDALDRVDVPERYGATIHNNVRRALSVSLGEAHYLWFREGSTEKDYTKWPVRCRGDNSYGQSTAHARNYIIAAEPHL
jgi:hypothetical protein